MGCLLKYVWGYFSPLHGLIHIDYYYYLQKILWVFRVPLWNVYAAKVSTILPYFVQVYPELIMFCNYSVPIPVFFFEAVGCFYFQTITLWRFFGICSQIYFLSILYVCYWSISWSSLPIFIVPSGELVYSRDMELMFHIYHTCQLFHFLWFQSVLAPVLS